MKQHNKPSIDGFIPRRSTNSQVGSQGGLQPSYEHSGLSHASDERELKGSALQAEHEGGLVRADIDESLQSIKTEEKQSAKPPKPPKQRKKRGKIKLILKIVVILIVLALIALGVIFAIKAIKASGSIFKGDLFGIIQSKELKMDENGRTNILVFGTSEDDEGHDAPYLTDSLMVVSVNQKKNNAYTFSIPRDLWVSYGKSCTTGNRGRINAVFQCHSDFGKDEKAGANALTKTVGEVTGLSIQYYAHVNYSVVRDVVGALGGVTVNIEGNGADGIMDSNFDWKCGVKTIGMYRTPAQKQKCPPNGYFIEYPNGPAHLDAEHALYLAMARGAGGGRTAYGLDQANYDREKNQQKIVAAIREKAMSAGTLADFTKVTGLIDAVGKNLRTNFETSEIRTLVRLAKDVSGDKIKSISLVDAEPAVFVNDNVNGASIVRSSEGFGTYRDIANFLQKKMNANPTTEENAKIGVYNGSGEAGKAQATADTITAKGLTVSDVGNAPEGMYGAYELYDLTQEKPLTRKKLESLYGVSAKTTSPPVSVVGLDFVLVIGK